MKRKKKHGSLVGAITFFLFFFFLSLILGLIGIFSIRDQLFLAYIQEQGPKRFGLEALAIHSIKTRTMGLISLELKGLLLQTTPTAPTIRAETAVLSTPNTILSLYQIWTAKKPLVLNARFEGLVVEVQHKPTEISAKTSPTESSPENTALDKNFFQIPLPLSLNLDFSRARLEINQNSASNQNADSMTIRDLTAASKIEIEPTAEKLEMRIRSTGQMALKLQLSERSALPIRTRWRILTQPKLQNSRLSASADIQELLISTVGIDLKSVGNFKWPEMNFDFKSSGFSADLGMMPLEADESKALGISGRMRGEANFAMATSGSLKKQIRASGQMTLKRGRLPLAIERSSPRPLLLKGPVDVDFDIPFSVLYDIPQKKIESIDLQSATAKLDLTEAELLFDKFLHKKANVTLGLQSELSSSGEIADINSLEFKLANFLLSAKGQASINSKRPSRLEIKASLPDVRGWPLILPFLSQIESSPLSAQQLAKTRGSISVTAKVDADIVNPEKLKSSLRLDIGTFDVQNFSFPLRLDFGQNFSKTGNSSKDGTGKTYQRSMTGMIQGQIQAAGLFSPDLWNLRRANGFLNLKELALEWEDVFVKKSGKDLVVRFDAASDGSKVKLDRLDIRSDGGAVSTKGLIIITGTEQDQQFRFEQNMSAQLELAQVYDFMPRLRNIRPIIPNGSLTSNYKISGFFSNKLGFEKSPLSLNGKTFLRAPEVLYLSASKSELATEAKTTSSAKTAESTDFSFLKWPVISNSQMLFDVQVTRLRHKSGALKAIDTKINLTKGNLIGSAKIAEGFGGSIELTSFRAEKLDSASSMDLNLKMIGLFTKLNLASLAEYLDPDFRSLLGGISSGKFQAWVKPLSNESFLDTTKLSGVIGMKNGFISSTKFDDLVNRKITENSQIAKLLKFQPTIATKGAAFDLSSDFSYSKNKMHFENLKMISPEKNALDLKGWIQLNLTTELEGSAYLTSTPVGGSFKAANSDALDRLVVPIKIHGSLKNPSVEIAEATIAAMIQKTIEYEANKTRQQIKGQVQKAIEQKKNEAVDKIKEELKKRGLTF
jgi:hypothetical protein